MLVFLTGREPYDEIVDAENQGGFVACRARTVDVRDSVEPSHRPNDSARVSESLAVGWSQLAAANAVILSKGRLESADWEFIY